MFRKKAIDDWAFDYWLLQQYAKLCFRIFYKKTEIINLHKIPLNQPVILAPNHQNALMDAMVLVCNTSFQNVFLARADIFKGKRLIKFLTFLNIMPIYRMRDGIENVKKNDEVFGKTIQVLHNRSYPLIMFPEGNHGEKRRLRQLVKGLFRIGLMAQEKFGEEQAVKIIPVGIDYGHYQHFRTTLFVNVGDPIELSEYAGRYAENQVAAINELKDRFAEDLSRQMIDIQSEEYYDMYMALRVIFNDDMREHMLIRHESLEAKYVADKAMIHILDSAVNSEPETIKNLDLAVKGYMEGVKNAGLRDWVIKRDHFGFIPLLTSVLIKVLLSPIFLFGFANNIIPYWFTATRTINIKDKQFHSSFKYVTGMLAFPAWYLVIAGILAFLSFPIGLIVIYILLLPAAGVFAFEYYIRLRKLTGRLRYIFGKRKPEIADLIISRSSIISEMNGIIERHKHLL